MGSLVAEILFSAGKLEKDDISQKVATLEKHVDDIKLKISELIESQYKEFTPCANNTEFLTEEVTNTRKEIRGLTAKIDNEITGQLKTTTNEFQDLQVQLKKSEIHSRFLNQLLDMHDNLQNVDNRFSEMDYAGAARALAKIKGHLGELSHDCDDQIHLLRCIRTEYLVKREKLIYDLSDVWHRHLTWTLPDAGGNSDVEFKLVLANDKSVSHIKNLLNAMHLLGNLEAKLKSFGEKFMKYIVIPINESSVNIRQNDHPHSVAFSIGRTTNLGGEPDACKVLEDLSTAFTFMYKSFLMIKVDGLEPSDGSVTLMEILSNLISEQFCEYVIQHCLAEAIPKSSKDLENYNPIIKASKKFQELLVEQGFLQAHSETLSAFTQNVNVLFVNKMCKDILTRARNIVKKELYSSVVVESEKNADMDGKDVRAKPLHPERKITNVFNFPKCHISSSSQELMDLVREVLDEASISSTVCAARLFYTSRNIFELYCDIVMTYHKETLKSLPLVSALYHNSCMYFAHQLQTLGHKYKPKLPESMADAHITYVDLVPRLRRLGSSVFLNQMLRQKKILMECLKDAQGFQNLAMDESFSPKAEKSIKQCLHQFQSLLRVWHNVLPLNVYLKAMGTLVNSFIENIVISVISQEDISADSAFQLTVLFQSISEETPALFQVSGLEGIAEIHQYVKYWSKFQELVVVLGESMHVLVDRWSAGKGPLANDFTAEEVKQLIRALFQNTDRRAAILAQIK